MTKREVIWLLIRLAGLYFLARGLLMAFSVLGILAFTSVSDSPGLVFGRLIETQLATLVVSLFFSALGLYLIYRGGAVFRVLNSQPDE